MRARREFLISLGAALAWSLPARAQLPRTMYRIGFLGNTTAALEANLIESFRQGLRDLGYEEGRNITIEYRWAEGKYERLPALIAELVALKLDVMVTAGTPAALAVKKAAISVPLVLAAIGDPVGVGLVPSLARPTGNITGLSAEATDLEGKRLQLLGEVVTGLSHIAVLWNPLNRVFQEISIRQLNAAGETLKIKVQPVPVQVAEDLDAAFATLVKDKPQALIILADRIFLHTRTRLMDFATQNRLPGIYAYRELVEAGGLMSYGPSYENLHRRAAVYVDKILKGAKPAELPIEQPTKFNLVINRRAAEALGLAIPGSILALADEVIE
jgi:putative tryptophan/tyrosine transport system substrate-binding protein